MEAGASSEGGQLRLLAGGEERFAEAGLGSGLLVRIVEHDEEFGARLARGEAEGDDGTGGVAVFVALDDALREGVCFGDVPGGEHDRDFAGALVDPDFAAQGEQAIPIFAF